MRIFHEQDRSTWSCYPSGPAWARQPHHWSYMLLEDTVNIDWATFTRRFVQRVLPVIPELHLIRVPVEGETTKVVGKNAWAIKRRKTDRFANFTDGAYLSTSIGRTQKRRTGYARHERMWLTNGMWACTKARRQCWRTNWALCKDLERSRTESGHRSPSVHYSHLGKLPVTSVSQWFQVHCSNQPSCPKVDLQHSACHRQTSKMPSPSQSLISK